MMSTKVTEPNNWGAERLSEREAKRRRKRWALLGWTMMVPVGVVLLDRLLHESQRAGEPHPFWMFLTMYIGLTIALGVGLWRFSHGADEVQSRIAINSLAVVGATALLLNLPVEVASVMLMTNITREAVWLTAAASGIIAYAWQRWRA